MKVNRFTRRLATGLTSVALLLTGLVATAASPANAAGSVPTFERDSANCNAGTLTLPGTPGTTELDAVLNWQLVAGGVSEEFLGSGGPGDWTHFYDVSADMKAFPADVFDMTVNVYDGNGNLSSSNVVQVEACATTPAPPVAGNFTFEMATPTCTDGAAYQVITTTSQDPVTRSVVVVYPDIDDRNFIIAQGETHPFSYLIPQGVAYSVQVLVDNVTLYDQAQPAFSCAQPPVRTSGPTVVGPVFRVGKVVKCVVTYTGTGGVVTPTYAWKRGTVTIAGATKSTYVLSYLDLGKRVTCGSGASNPVGSVPMVYSAASAVVALGLAPHIVSATYNPRVVGTVKRGYTVKAYVGRWVLPTPTAYAYQWYEDGRAIKGATKSSFKIPSTYRNHKLSVRITAIKAGYARGYKFSAAYKVR